MVYESDFYTTRRPYRAPNPSYSSYTASSSIVPSRQVRILPGIGKVYVVHSYDRIIPYVGHKRLAVVTHQVPHTFRVRPSVIIREIDRIQHKARPYVYYSPTSHWLNSEPATYSPYYYSWYNTYYPPYSSVLYNYPYYNRFWREIYWSRLYPSYPTHVWSKMFEDETKAIRAQTNALLKRCQTHVPRPERSWPVTTTVTRRYLSYDTDDYYYWPYYYSPYSYYRYYYPYSWYNRYSWTPELTWPSKVTSDDFVYRMLTPIRNVKNDIYNISHYYAEPLVRKLVGGGLACVKYGGDKAYSRRRNLTLQEIYAMQSDAVRGDIQLLSYYIKANKERKMMEGDSAPLPPARPSRKFTERKWFMQCLEPDTEIIELRKQREDRLAKIHALEYDPLEKEKRNERNEQRELAQEKAVQAEKAKKEEAARQAELARQEALAAQAAVERAAELEKKKEAERKRKEEEAAKCEDGDDEHCPPLVSDGAEEERIAAEKAAKEEAAKKAAKEEAERKAKEEEAARIAKEKEEATRLEEEKRLAELARQEEERQQLLRLEEIARQAEEEKEKELARQAEELAALARQEAELAEQARREAELAELAQKEAELMELEKQEKELAELDRQEREAATLAREDKVLAEQKLECEEIAAAAEAVSSDEVVSSDEHTAEPVIEEPVTPDVQHNAPAMEASSSEVETEED